VLPARTSYRLMMTLMSNALETYVRALEICESSYTGRSARLFFMLEPHGPQRTARHMVAQSPPHREVGSRAARHVAH
jgi:hypothetical protein